MTKYYRVPLSDAAAIRGGVGGPLISRQDNARNLDTFAEEQEAFDNQKFACFKSKKSFFVILNAIAASFHLMLFIATIIFTCQSDAKCGGPVVYTYQTNLTYRAKTTDSGFELVPKYEKNIDHPIYLVSLPLIFFGMSFAAHVTVGVLAGCTTIYRDWLLTCQQPVRCAHGLKPLSHLL